MARRSSIGRAPDMFSFLPHSLRFATKGYRCFAARLVEMSLLVLSECVWPTQFPLGRRRLSRSSLPPLPNKRTSSISAVAAGGAVRPVSFLLGGTVIGVEATWFEWGSNEAHVVNGSSQCGGCGRGGFCCCCFYWLFCLCRRLIQRV